MGAWSETIMGNDTNADAELDIADWAKLTAGDCLSSWYEYPTENREKLSAITGETWRDYLTSIDDETTRYATAQAAAVMIMQVGAILPEEVKSVAIASCENEELENWSNPEKRKAHLDNFIENINTYDNKTPTVLPEEGLFEVILKSMNKKEKPTP